MSRVASHRQQKSVTRGVTTLTEHVRGRSKSGCLQDSFATPDGSRRGPTLGPDGGSTGGDMRWFAGWFAAALLCGCAPEEPEPWLGDHKAGPQGNFFINNARASAMAFEDSADLPPFVAIDWVPIDGVSFDVVGHMRVRPGERKVVLYRVDCAADASKQLEPGEPRPRPLSITERTESRGYKPWDSDADGRIVAGVVCDTRPRE